jgi:tetratricopeptide (TPR) repeat protein
MVGFGCVSVSPTTLPEVGPRRWDIIIGGAIIVIAALWVYHNSFAVPFVLDDYPAITGNTKIRHLWPIWDALSPSATSVVGGRPVVNLSFAINYALGGTAVWGYHALNLAIHILVALTLFGILRRTFLSSLLRERFGTSATRLALAVAVLWTVHPLQTEAVTYISERCESLMGLFYLLTLYCFIRGADSTQSGWWYALSVVACLLGMASKEVMVTAPMIVLLYDRIFVSGSFRAAWTRHRPVYLGLASTWLLLGCLMVGLHNRGAGYGLSVSWWAYALIECRTVAHYLWLAVWPHPLCFDYGELVGMWHVREVVPYALILGVLIVVVLVALRRKPAIGFVGAWCLMILAPTSSVVPVAGQPMAEHRMYLPLASVVIMGVIVIDACMVHRRSTVAFLALIVGLGLLTVQRNEDYRTELSIWNDTVAKCPNGVRAHNNLGEVLMGTGKVREAIDHYEQALRIDPYYAEAHLNLGIALDKMGRSQEAIAQDEEALRIRPDDAKAQYNLGVALWHAGQLREAIGHYEGALRIDPDFIEAHVNLAIALAQVGSNQDALAHFMVALRLRPDSPEVHCNLGQALFQAGKVTEAVEHFKQALRIKPDYVEAHFNLAVALEKLGRTPEAIEQYQQALKLRPDFAPARNALARLHASS